MSLGRRMSDHPAPPEPQSGGDEENQHAVVVGTPQPPPFVHEQQADSPAELDPHYAGFDAQPDPSIEPPRYREPEPQPPTDPQSSMQPVRQPLTEWAPPPQAESGVQSYVADDPTDPPLEVSSLEHVPEDHDEVETVVERAHTLPRVIAIANQKGGVGKTTTTVNLGAALAELDHRVLIVDLDPQGNASTGLGVDHRALEFTVYDLLLNDASADECIEPTDLKGLFLIAANLDLAGAEVELVNQMSRETRLKRSLDEVKDEYDYILIDCPPSLGLLTINALVAATEVLVPIQCEFYALEGLGQLTRNVELVKKNLNPSLDISTIVLVMYNSRTNLSEQVAQDVRSHFGDKVCRNVIPRNVRLSEAPSFGQPITVFDPSSRGAVAYRELAREVSHGA